MNWPGTRLLVEWAEEDGATRPNPIDPATLAIICEVPFARSWWDKPVSNAAPGRHAWQ